MSISSLSPVSSGSAYSSTLSLNNQISQLEKQKLGLQREIQTVSTGNDDEKTIQEKIKQLQTQLQQVETQIRQLKSEKTSKSQNTAQTQNQNSALTASAAAQLYSKNRSSSLNDLLSGNTASKFDMKI